MHQIDLGVIISFFKAILRKYYECVEKKINIAGKAAKKLTHRLQSMLKKYAKEGHTMSGKHNCLLPVTYAVSSVFSQLSDKKKPSRHLQATYYRQHLLVLPFILDNLFHDELKDYNKQRRQGQPEVIDPSAELIAVTKTFLSWYKLFRRITPAKTLDDVARS